MPGYNPPKVEFEESRNPIREFLRGAYSATPFCLEAVTEINTRSELRGLISGLVFDVVAVFGSALGLLYCVTK